MFKKLKLTVKLAMFFSLVCVISVLSLGIGSYIFAKKIVLEKTEEELDEIVSTTEMNIQQTVELLISN